MERVIRDRLQQTERAYYVNTLVRLTTDTLKDEVIYRELRFFFYLTHAIASFPIDSFVM